MISKYKYTPPSSLDIIHMQLSDLYSLRLFSYILIFISYLFYIYNFSSKCNNSR